MGDGDFSFKNRIALQFLNDFPTHSSAEALFEEDFYDPNGKIQELSFVSTTLKESTE